MASEWHDFFLLAGTAAATLMGLVFVAVSFAVGSKAERTTGDVDAWITPALMFFTEAFVVSAVSVAPMSAHVLAGLVLVPPLIGAPYGAWRLRFFWRQHGEEALDGKTWIWHAILPLGAHAGIVTGAVLLFQDDDRGLPPIAAGTVVLVLCAVRNAWTLVVYLIEQR